MKNQILILPFAIEDDHSAATEDHLSRQIPVIVRNCVEKSRPGRLVASPLATEVDGQRQWILHRRLWDDDKVREFAAERGYSMVVYGCLIGAGKPGSFRTLRLKALNADLDRPIIDKEIHGNSLDLVRKILASLSVYIPMITSDAAQLFDPGTISPLAFEHYLKTLDSLLVLRSPDMQLDDASNVLDSATQALELDPGMEEALTAGLSCALQVTEPRGSEIPLTHVIDSLDEWIDIYPCDARLYGVKAEILINHDEKKRALQALREGLRVVDPPDRDLIRRSGDLYVEFGRIKEALEAYAECEEIEHDEKIVERMASLNIMLGRNDAALKILQGLVTKDDDRASLWARLALIYHQNGDMENVWANLTRMFGGLTAPKDAELEKVNTILGNNKPTREFVAAVREWMPPENFGSEEKLLFARTLRLVGARIEAGLCLGAIDTKDMPITFQSKVARERLNLRHEEFDTRFAELAQSIVNDGVFKDVSLIDSACELEPAFWPARFLNGLVLSKQGNFEESVQELETVLDIVPENDVVWFTRGLQLARLGRDAAARSSFESAIELNAKEADYHTNLALALARQGERERALEEYEEGIRLRPDHPQKEAIRRTIEGDGDLQTSGGED